MNISKDIENEWLTWMKEVHVPDVLATNCFISASISYVTNSYVTDEQIESSSRYLCAYTCDSLDKYEHYQREFAPSLQQDHRTKFDGKFSAERMLLKTEATF